MFDDQAIMVPKFLPFSGDPDPEVFMAFKSVLSSHQVSLVWKHRRVCLTSDGSEFCTSDRAQEARPTPMCSDFL